MAGSTPIFGWDDQHAAFQAGYDLGHAHGQQAASEDLARGWLHNLALDALNLTVRHASKHGPAWTNLVTATQ